MTLRKRVTENDNVERKAGRGSRVPPRAVVPAMMAFCFLFLVFLFSTL